MALPKTLSMRKSAERARKRYLDEVRKTALTNSGKQRTLADTVVTLKAADAAHRYFTRETALLTRVSERLAKLDRNEKAKALNEKIKRKIRELQKLDSVNSGASKSVRDTMKIVPWK